MFSRDDQVICPDGQALVLLVVHGKYGVKLKLKLFTGQLVTWAAKDCEVISFE